MYLGIKAVIAKSFARIHKANLINFGILPLVFEDTADFDGIEAGDELEINGLTSGLTPGSGLTLKNVTQGTEVALRHDYSPIQTAMIKAGGRLNYTVSGGV